MNKFVRYSMLAVYVGAGVSAVAKADPQIQMDKRDPTFNAGPVAVTLGGFTELAGIYRAHDEQADVGSSFYKVPFPGAAQNFGNTPVGNPVVGGTTGSVASTANPQQYYEPEFRMSARQSRFSLLAQYGDSSNKLEYYMETDFLSSGSTSNSNESNSYTLRMRHFYGDWQTADWSILAGQTWSMATPFSHGLDIRKQYTPLTIDAQYVVGFNWARQAQLRIVRKLGVFGNLGISLEEPQLGTGLSGTAAGGGTTTSTPGNGSGLLNPSTNYSDDIAPDVIVKYAIDPGFGHYEIYSLTRFLHDRGNGPANNKINQNHTNIGESVGVSFVIPVVPKMLDFMGNGIIGHGNGRYGSGQLGDAVTNPNNGQLSPTLEQQFLVGLVAHPTPRLDTYVYAGMENEKVQYADGGSNNTGCDTNPGNATANLPCTGNIGNERQIAFGVWWKAYKGAIGSFQIGAQGSYLVNHTLPDSNGVVGRTEEPMGFVSFRFYPFQ